MTQGQNRARVNHIERMSDGHYVTQYVDVCRECKGLGGVEHRPDLTARRMMVTCPVCQGSGRVFIRKEIKVTVEPYKSIQT